MQSITVSKLCTFSDIMEATQNLTLQENFTCGKWNLTEYEANIQNVHGWWVQGLASIIMGLFGIVVNIIMIIVLSSQEFRRIFFNKLIISLTISDILFLACSVYESLRLHFVDTDYCSLQGFLQIILYPFRKITMCFSIYMTVVLTFERYLAVTAPITHRNRYRTGSSWTRRFLKYISPVFLVSFVLCGTPLFFAFKMEAFTFNITTNNTLSNSSLDYDVEEETVYCMAIWWRTNKMYILLYSNLTNFIITGAIPFLLLLSFNCKIYIAIRDSLRTRNQLNIQRSTRFSNPKIEETQQDQDKSKDILQSMVLFGMVISFFICHVLRVVLNMEEIIYFEDINQIKVMEEKLGVRCTGVQFWTMIAGDLSHFFLQVNSSINFFIYGYISSQFKKALKDKIFRCDILCNKCITEQRSIENDGKHKQYDGNVTIVPLTDYTECKSFAETSCNDVVIKIKGK